MAACGGGGGGTGGGTGGGGVVYSGVTTPALIDEKNAVELSQSVIGAGDLPSTFTAVSTAESENRAEIIQLARILAGVVKTRAESRSTSSDMQVFAGFQDSGTEKGDCSGTVQWSETYNESSGDYKESAKFTNYSNDCFYYLNGTIRIVGNDYTDSETISFESLNFQAGGENLTLAGTMVWESISLYEDHMTMNLVLRDERAGKIFKLDNYVVKDDWEAGTIEISGRFYHSDYGYVTISTPELIGYGPFTYAPSEGRLRIEGTKGTSATVTFNGDAGYVIKVDSDGDDAIDSTFNCTNAGVCSLSTA